MTVPLTNDPNELPVYGIDHIHNKKRYEKKLKGLTLNGFFSQTNLT